MQNFMFFVFVWILKLSFICCDDTDPCDSGYDGLLPHPTECQLYYNCSLPASEFKPWLGKHVMECVYPDLFDSNALKCADFLGVKCLKRARYDHACEYRNNMCRPDSNCKRCQSDFTCETGNGHQCTFEMADPIMEKMCPSLLPNNICFS